MTFTNYENYHKKHRLTVPEVEKVVDWLMDDELLPESKNGPVTEKGTRYRIMNNYNYYYVKKFDHKVALTQESRDLVQKTVRARLDKKYGTND